MKNLNVTQGILISSTTVRYGLFVATAVVISKLCWWLVNPLGYHTINNISSANLKSEIIAQGVVNRAPFGTVVIEKEAPPPSNPDQIKAVGTYAAGPHNSIAFLEVNGKNIIVGIGESVLTSIVKAINPNGVVLNNGKEDLNLDLSQSSNHPSGPGSNPMNNNMTNNNYPRPSSHGRAYNNEDPSSAINSVVNGSPQEANQQQINEPPIASRFHKRFEESDNNKPNN